MPDDEDLPLAPISEDTAEFRTDPRSSFPLEELLAAEIDEYGRNKLADMFDSPRKRLERYRAKRAELMRDQRYTEIGQLERVSVEYA
jgi:hypothetical protein